MAFWWSPADLSASVEDTSIVGTGSGTISLTSITGTGSGDTTAPVVVAFTYDEKATPSLSDIESVVSEGAGTTVDVAAFSYVLNGELQSYAGSSGFAVPPSSSSFVFLLGGALTTNTSGYPEGDTTLPLARVTTSGAAITEIIADLVSASAAAPTIVMKTGVSPPTPAAERACVYVESADMHVPSVWDDNGFRYELMPEMATCGGFNALAISSIGASQWLSQGVTIGGIAALTGADMVSATVKASMISDTVANSAVELYMSAPIAWRGNAAGLGGFTFTISVYKPSTLAGHTGFHGLSSSTSALSATLVPQNMTDCIGLAYEGTDTNWFLQHNDASGTATRVALGTGSDYALAGGFMTLTLHCLPNASSIYYKVSYRKTTGTISQSGVLTTNLPTSSVFLSPHTYENNGGNAVATTFYTCGMSLTLRG